MVGSNRFVSQIARLVGCSGLVAMVLTGCATIPSRPAPDAAKANEIIRTAKGLLGTPYRYGGTTTKGFDCSGFVQYVFRNAAGVKLPRSSPKQFSATAPVRSGEEQPSDLLFWSIDHNGPSHVGIYLGHGRFVHAPGKGDAVKISDGNERYWRGRFLGVRRALQP
jgi:cell wall-associated NlpC family hydrolase